jgi:hypothetical protein
MYFASAYPDSALSAGMLVLIALVVLATLALWLGLVFLADRPPKKDSGQPASRLPAMAQPDEAAEDEHSGAGPAPAGRRHGAAA